jgi:hypothetical protein
MRTTPMDVLITYNLEVGPVRALRALNLDSPSGLSEPSRG